MGVFGKNRFSATETIFSTKKCKLLFTSEVLIDIDNRNLSGASQNVLSTCGVINVL